MLRLNFCVRYGNRWIPQAIATGNMGLPGASRIPDSLGFTLLSFSCSVLPCSSFPLALRVARFAVALLPLPFLRSASSGCHGCACASPFSFAPALPLAAHFQAFAFSVNSRFSFAPCTLKTAQVFESRGFSPASARLRATNALACFRILHVSMPSERSHRLRGAFARLSLCFGFACFPPASFLPSQIKPSTD